MKAIVNIVAVSIAVLALTACSTVERQTHVSGVIDSGTIASPDPDIGK